MGSRDPTVEGWFIGFIQKKFCSKKLCHDDVDAKVGKLGCLIWILEHGNDAPHGWLCIN